MTDKATRSKRGLLAGLVKKEQTNKQTKQHSELVTVSYFACSRRSDGGVRCSHLFALSPRSDRLEKASCV